MCVNKKLIAILIAISVIGMLLIGVEQQFQRQKRVDLMMNDLFN